MNLAFNFINGLLLTHFRRCALLFITKETHKSTKEFCEKLSNGDENFVKIDIKNLYGFNIKTKIIDEKIQLSISKEIFD